MSASSRHHRVAGSLRRPPWTVWLSPSEAGWSWTSLRVIDLPAGGFIEFDTVEDELVVLPLSGSCRVASGGIEFELNGRLNVFSGVSDFAYVPRDSSVQLTSTRGGRFALPGAKASRRLPFRYGAASGVELEARGAGRCSRIVRNFCTPDVFEADRLIACEVLTPNGNWSSYPPHKHDESTAAESALEEIYYFEIAASRFAEGMGYQRVYGTADKPIDVLAEVRSGDIVLVPYGWHGPSMAIPGYDMYYLNAMAGANSRAWLPTTDPNHAWIKEAWTNEPVDSRIAAAIQPGS